MKVLPFIFGIDGLKPTRAAVRLLNETRAAGVILFARNIDTPAQTRALVRGLSQAAGRPLLFTIDHEGGWVLRFRSGLTAFPGNAALGASGRRDWARRTGEIMGRELHALGIGINFAPVLDVVGERYNPGIGIRSFGGDPALVAALGAAFIRGQQSRGVAATAKHFPGKGAATRDAHLELPVIRLGKTELDKTHLAPFRAAVRAGVEAVMTSHMALPAYDPSGTPATFSRPIVSGLLRRKIGFRGTIISDDLCMGAVTRGGSVPQAAVDALSAGHDLLIVSQNPVLQRESAELVDEALAGGLLEPARRRALQRRLSALLRRRAAPPRGPLPKPDSRFPLAAARAAVRVLRRGAAPLPVVPGPGGTRRIAALFPDLREVRDRFTFEGGHGAPLKNLRGLLSRAGFSVKARTVPVLARGPSAPLLGAARSADLTLFFCFEALRFPGQRAALESLRRADPARLVVLLLRGRWDLRLAPPRTTVLSAEGYRKCQIQALIEALL